MINEDANHIEIKFQSKIIKVSFLIIKVQLVFHLQSNKTDNMCEED